jgi:hypothetical protein
MLKEPKQKRNIRKRFEDKKDQRSTYQELDLAKDLGGKRRAYSGANRPVSVYNQGPGYNGDVTVGDYEIEAKRTDKDSISLKIDWLIKISKGAAGRGKKPAVQIQFDKLNSVCDNKWVLIEQSTFKELLGGD